jgi:NADH:ubiquinone oxidoreductase subunit 5 (subunit L)/multisubunit Na+/H+ antiporter MnhA subunit
MELELFLPLFLLIPLLGFIVSFLLPERNERAIFLSMGIPAAVQSLLAIGFTIYWAIFDRNPLNIKEITLYSSEHYKFFIDLFFDKVTATYLIMSSLLTFMISVFSRGYMHKDNGYKRYFNTMILYFFGVQVIIFSGNFETMFIGWEILGLSSFLLIAYYRDRYLPVRNGFKVFSMYRLADLGMLMAMWLMHHLFHENITFFQLRDQNFVLEHLHGHELTAIIISFAIILAASVKSAQFPFSSWLPRAMEGPTPSSSIFYGSIAVHIGIYLMLRTYPFWHNIMFVKVNVIMLGLLTGFVSSSIAKVQFTIKGQIAYSSLAQIGLMMVEVAMGWEILALIHLTGNAFLRSYQLLISPSIVTYMLRDQFFNFVASKKGNFKPWQLKLYNTMYVLALKEFYMDNYIYKYLWFPFKRWGGKIAGLSTKSALIIFAFIGSLAIYLLAFYDYDHMNYKAYIPDIFGVIALAFVLRAFTIRKHPFGAWILLVLNHFWIAFAVSFNEHFSYVELVYYLSGVVVSGVIGYFLLLKLAKTERFSLNDYYGHAIEHKVLAFLFLLCALSLAGFPITTTFLGEDLLFSHVHISQPFFMAMLGVNYVIAGISIMRIYSRIFMGPNHKWYRPEARRAS